MKYICADCLCMTHGDEGHPRKGSVPTFESLMWASDLLRDAAADARHEADGFQRDGFLDDASESRSHAENMDQVALWLISMADRLERS